MDAKKLTKEQSRVLEAAVKRTEPVGISAMTLVEIAILVDEGKINLKTSLEEFFDDLKSMPALRLLPLTYEIGVDLALLASLRDPADRAIAATARVHRLKLLTSDERIIKSKLVAVVE